MGQIEVDESYFGARRVRRERGRGAKGKTIVFGLIYLSIPLWLNVSMTVIALVIALGLFFTTLSI